MLSACTIIAGNYLPFARVLAASFLAHHPEATFTVLVIDRDESAPEPPDRPNSRASERPNSRGPDLPSPRVTWLTLGDIGLDRHEIHRLAGIYDVTELATAVKPVLLRHLLDRGEQAVAYLDPDIQVYAPLDDIGSLANQHAIVLTPHTMQPFPKDDRQVDDYFVLAAGVYNLGFVGIGPSARPFLEWWWQVTRREALSDVSRNMFTDQRWVDFVPSFFDHWILKDSGCNVAYWNLHGRELTFDGSRYLVDGAPLRFFHFSGFDPRKPGVLSKHQGDRPRILLSDRPVLARLCAEYASSLEGAGLSAGPAPRYGWARAANDLELTTRMRRLYRSGLLAAERGGVAEPPDPFDRSNPEAFLTWLNAPEEDGPREISRYLHSIYRERLDLQIQFPDLHGQDGSRLVAWIWQDSDLRENTPMELLPVSSTPRSPMPRVEAPTVSPTSVAIDLSPVAPLDALLKHLDEMNVIRTGGEEGAFSGLRLWLQRILFRVLRPYAFQQQHLNTQVIAGLRQAAAAMRREEQLRESAEARMRDLTRELLDVKRELRRLKQEQGQP
jgi:hypothetical protein